MSTNDSKARYVPPDPGGRSRFLLRAIVIACVLGAVIAVVLMFLLHQTPPPPTPEQKPQSQSRVVLPVQQIRRPVQG